MPITFPSTPTLNQQHITGGKTWIWNGTNWAASVPAGNISPNVLSISSNVVPAATTTYDLGTDTARWRDLYLAGNTIDLGGTAIKSTVSGVTISSAANANIAVGIAVDTVRLGTGANAITITATNTGLQTTNSANVVIPIGGGGSTVTVANTAPLTPSVGSMWLDNDTGDFRVYFGNAWAGIGVGPIGATGVQGATGIQGANGIQGNIGPQGATGVTGATGPAGSGGGLAWQAVQTSNFTAVVGRAYPINTTSGGITVTLPSSALAGNEIILTDYAGTWGTNNVSVNPNGLKITGLTANQTLAISYSSVNLVYVDATVGWIVHSGMTASPFVPPGPPTLVEYLVVGGGGGGATNGGGGGAGGYRTSASFAVSAGTPYTVTVGAGGSAQGSDSVFSTITSTGGGAGGPANVGSTGAGAGGNGGSGGGGGWASGGGTSPGGSGNTPGVTPSQGNNGGTGQHSPGTSASAGGGGGAGGAGTNASGYTSGAGGNGSATSITGVSTYYAGGGGGGRGTAAPGGIGGGGSNPGNGAGTAGGVNTGGGGGGGSTHNGGSSNAGGGGGSGIVVIAYPDAKTSIASIGVGLTYTIDTTSRPGYKVYRFTAGTGTISW